MEQEYTISTIMKLIYGALALVMFGFAGFVLSMHKNPDVSPVVYCIPVLIFAGGVLVLINLFRRKVIINSDRISCINLFSNKELAIKAIKGSRVGKKAIVLESNADGSKIIITNYNDLADSESLVYWAETNFKNLDAADLENERNELLQDNTIGVTEEEREANLKRAKIIATAYNIGGGIAGFITLFYDNRLMVIVLIAYPLIGIVLLWRSKGLIKFLSNPKRSVYPYIGLGILLSAFIPLIKTLDYYNVFNTNSLWLPVIIIGGVVFIMLFLTGINKSIPVGGQYVLMVAIAVIYAFGTVLRINYAFDDSELRVYPAKVFDRRISHGKHTSYYLTISKWGPQTKSKQVDVGRRLYENTNIGDTVHVNFKTGKLGIPWYTVSK